MQTQMDIARILSPAKRSPRMLLTFVENVQEKTPMVSSRLLISRM